jgi:prophage maintenance system killer protein
MVYTYYEIGRMIVEEEQNGNKRAAYGKQILKELSKRLTTEFEKGFSQRNLEQMRQFYLTYSKTQTLSAEFNLSWSHYLKLMRIDNEDERRYYQIEAYENNWSLRELQRQFDSALYERLVLSRDKKSIKKLSEKGQVVEDPTDTIKDPYDYQSLEIKNTSGKETYQITYEEAISQIKLAKKAHGNSDLFGHEKDESFKSSIGTIYQTFGGEDLYPSIEEKAGNLLYFITKNHSFTDGNKRIAAFLFLYFMEKNGILFDANGNKRIADNALVALTLMIAVSNPDEKEMMVKVIVNLINKNNNAW